MRAGLCALDLDGFGAVNERLGRDVGVAVAAPGTAGPAELMPGADVALSWAKAQGRGHVVVFDPDHDAELTARTVLLGQLRNAVARDEFRLLYQPLVGLADGQVREPRTSASTSPRWSWSSRAGRPRRFV